MATVTPLQGVVLALLAAAFSLHVSGLAMPEWVVADLTIYANLKYLPGAPPLDVNVTIAGHGTQGLFETCSEAEIVSPEPFRSKVQEWECTKREPDCDESAITARNCIKMDTVIAFSIMGTILTVAGLLAAALWTFKKVLKDRIVGILPLVAAIFLVIGLVVYSTVESDSDNTIGKCVWMMIAGAILNLISAIILFTGKAGPYTSTVFRLE